MNFDKKRRSGDKRPQCANGQQTDRMLSSRLTIRSLPYHPYGVKLDRRAFWLELLAACARNTYPTDM